MPDNYPEALSIQSNYFDLMEKSFGRYHDEMKHLGLTPAEFAKRVVADSATNHRVLRELDKQLDDIKSFWSTNYVQSVSSLSSSSSLTSVFGGNFFPTEDRSIVRSAGIYVDTIILPEPLLRVGRNMGVVRNELLSAQVISNGIKALIYRDVIFLDKKTPLAIILPEPNSLDQGVQEVVSSLTDNSVVSIASTVFQHNFSDTQAVMEFFVGVETSTEFISLVQQPDLLALRDDVSLSLEQQITELAARFDLGLNDQMSFLSLGHMIYGSFVGRIAQITELLVKAETLGSSPLVETDGAWRQLLTHYGQMAPNQQLVDAAITKALQSRERPGLNLLTATTLDDLRGFRVAEDLAEVRGKIRAGINEIAAATEELLPTTVNQVADNLAATFAEHSQKIGLLKQDRKQYYGQDLWKCVVPAGVALVGTYLGYVPAELIGTLTSFMGLPTTAQLLPREREIIHRGKQLNQSAAGMLFKHVRS